MSVELQLMGVACNLSCPYCYQNPIRDAGNFPRGYDLEKVKAALENEGKAFSMFGGEPLLVPVNVLEELWAFGLEKWGRNAIQTNAALINEEHIRLFWQYRVGVGISIDGPKELNDSRWAGTIESTRKATTKSQRNLERLLEQGTYRGDNGRPVPPSIIVTIGRHNGLPEHRARLKTWLRDLEDKGLRTARLHQLEVESAELRERFALTTEENIEFFTDMHAFERTLKHLQFDVFTDIRNLMRGDDRNVTCVWNACDPWQTAAVRGVDAYGGTSNCGRTNKDGIDWKKADVTMRERQMGLYVTPFEEGGCGGCRFWVMCKGHCPGTGIDQDWREKTADCALWLALFELVEREMRDYKLTPLSRAPFLSELERRMFDAWAAGSNAWIHGTIKQILKEQKNETSEQQHEGDDGQHGDHTDHGDSAHGDEAHGDHTDTTNPAHGDAT